MTVDDGDGSIVTKLFREGSYINYGFENIEFGKTIHENRMGQSYEFDLFGNICMQNSGHYDDSLNPMPIFKSDIPFSMPNIQSGEVTLTINLEPGGNQNYAEDTVSFDENFISSPYVVCTLSGAVNYDLGVRVSSIGSDEFTMTVWSYTDPLASTSFDVTVHWIAIL